MGKINAPVAENSCSARASRPECTSPSTFPQSRAGEFAIHCGLDHRGERRIVFHDPSLPPGLSSAATGMSCSWQNRLLCWQMPSPSPRNRGRLTPRTAATRPAWSSETFRVRRHDAEPRCQDGCRRRSQSARSRSSATPFPDGGRGRENSQCQDAPAKRDQRWDSHSQAPDVRGHEYPLPSVFTLLASLFSIAFPPTPVGIKNRRAWGDTHRIRAQVFAVNVAKMVDEEGSPCRPSTCCAGQAISAKPLRR